MVKRAEATEQDADIRQRLPEIEGLRPEAAEVLRLVNRILQPSSADDGARALFALVEIVGWNEHADERHFLALCALWQTLLYKDGWERDVPQLIAAIRKSERARKAKQRRKPQRKTRL